MDKKTIVLDLDHTLVYASRNRLKHYNFICPIQNFGLWYVQKRPGVDSLLLELSRNYEIVVFTASTKHYADTILDGLDANKVISDRFYRDSCTDVNGVLVKDLAKLGRDLKNVIIVDDNPASYKLQGENAFPVKVFKGDRADNELRRVIDFCKMAKGYEDIREALEKYRVQFDISRGFELIGNFDFQIEVEIGKAGGFTNCFNWRKLKFARVLYFFWTAIWSWEFPITCFQPENL